MAGAERDTRGSAGGLQAHFDLAFPVAYAIVYALVALWLHARFFPIGDVGVESDFYESLARAAQELLNGHLSVAAHPYKGPFYSFALAFVHSLGGDWYTNGVVLNALCSAGSVIVLYRLLLRTFNRWVAVSGTLSTSLVAELFVHSHKASTDLLFFLLCLITIGALLVDRPLWLPLVGSAVFAAFAFLTRYNGIFLVTAAAVVILIIDPWELRLRRRLAAVAVYVAVFLVVCAPWFAMNLAETGELLSTDNLRNVTSEFYSAAEDNGRPVESFSSLAALIAHDPVHFVSHYLGNVPRHLFLDVAGTVGLAIGILMVLGALLLLLTPPTRSQAAFYSFGILYFLSMCMVFWTSRFPFPTIPTYVALGFSLLLGPLGERRTRLGLAVSDRFFGFMKWLTGRQSAGAKATAALLVSAVLLTQIFGILRVERFYYDRRPLFILPAAQFLRERAGGAEEDTILARKPHIAYYANMRYRPYPTQLTDGRDFIASAIERQADYVVFSKLEYTFYPDADWLVNLEVEYGVDLIYSSEEINIYEIADWLDLESPHGIARLREKLAGLSDLRRDGRQEDVMRTCVEISMLHSLNRDFERAGEYLLLGLEAAGKPPRTEGVEMGMRFIWSELLIIAHAYEELGRRDEGSELIADGVKLVDPDGSTRMLPGDVRPGEAASSPAP